MRTPLTNPFHQVIISSYIRSIELCWVPNSREKALSAWRQQQWNTPSIGFLSLDCENSQGQSPHFDQFLLVEMFWGAANFTDDSIWFEFESMESVHRLGEIILVVLEIEKGANVPLSLCCSYCLGYSIIFIKAWLESWSIVIFWMTVRHSTTGEWRLGISGTISVYYTLLVTDRLANPSAATCFS
jgi:hypothetical protein